MKSYPSVSAYIKSTPKAYQPKLVEMRSIIQTTFPNAIEKISYGMPTYTLNEKPLVYFAAMKGHFGIYPTPGPINEYKNLLTDFSTSKGCIRIPYSQPLPKQTIVKLLKYRAKEIKSEAKQK